VNARARRRSARNLERCEGQVRAVRCLSRVGIALSLVAGCVARGEPSRSLSTAGGDEAPGSGNRQEVASEVEAMSPRTAYVTPAETSLAYSTLDPSSVVATIRSLYVHGVRGCYQRLLQSGPHAGGRVEVRFKVGPTGGVIESSVRGFDATVARCIRDLTVRWTFGVPRDPDGIPTWAEFLLPLALEPP